MWLNKNLILFLIVFFIIACHSNKNKLTYDQIKNKFGGKYNDEGFITTFGESPIDFHQAENSAIINISKQINSQIEHQYTSHENYIESKGKKNFQNEFLNIISNLKLSTNFEHVELIKFDPDSYIKDKRCNYFVLGYLKRMDLYNLLLPKYNNETTKFISISELISQNINEGNFKQVSDGLNEIKNHYSQILKNTFEIYVITKKYPIDKDKIEEIFLNAISRVLEFKGSITLYIPEFRHLFTHYTE